MGFKMNKIKADLGSYPHYILIAMRKFGKTTFFRDLVIKEYGDASHGLLISCGTENGYHALDNLQVEDAFAFNQDYDEETDTRGLVQIIDDVIENNKENGIKVVGFDTFDTLYDIAETEAIRQSRKETGKPCKSINDALGGFGRGIERVIDIIQEQIARLEQAGIAVFILSHVKEKTRTDMMTGTEYQVWTNNLMDKVYGAIADTSQMVMMGVFDRTIEDGRITGENRVLYLRPTATLEAGCRFNGLPEKIPFTVDAFLDAFKTGVKNSATVSQIDDDEFEKRRKQEKVEAQHKAEIALKKEMESKSADADEANRDTYLATITNKFPDQEKEVKDKAKGMLIGAGFKKFSDPDVPASLLKDIAAIME